LKHQKHTTFLIFCWFWSEKKMLSFYYSAKTMSKVKLTYFILQMQSLFLKLKIDAVGLTAKGWVQKRIQMWFCLPKFSVTYKCSGIFSTKPKLDRVNVLELLMDRLPIFTQGYRSCYAPLNPLSTSQIWQIHSTCKSSFSCIKR
jgi:hypothetical protein